MKEDAKEEIVRSGDGRRGIGHLIDLHILRSPPTLETTEASLDEGRLEVCLRPLLLWNTSGSTLQKDDFTKMETRGNIPTKLRRPRIIRQKPTPLPNPSSPHALKSPEEHHTPIHRCYARKREREFCSVCFLS